MSRYQGIVDKALAGNCSPRQAIKAKCLDCCCFDISEITNCTVTVCPLFKFRPFQTDAQPLRPKRYAGNPAGVIAK